MRKAVITLMPFENVIRNQRTFVIAKEAYYAYVFKVGLERTLWWKITPEELQQTQLRLNEFERIIPRHLLIELGINTLWPALGTESRDYFLTPQGYQALRKDYAAMLAKVNIKAKYPHKRGKGFRTHRMTIRDLDKVFAIYFTALKANMRRAIKHERNQISKSEDNIAYIHQLRRKVSRTASR